MSKYFPHNYFSVKLQETLPPLTGPIQSEVLLGGCVEYLPCPSRPSCHHLPQCSKRLARMGHFFGLCCPLASGWVWPLQVHPQETRRREWNISGHLFPRMPLCRISMGLNKECPPLSRPSPHSSHLLLLIFFLQILATILSHLPLRLACFQPQSITQSLLVSLCTDHIFINSPSLKYSPNYLICLPSDSCHSPDPNRIPLMPQM